MNRRTALKLLGGVPLVIPAVIKAAAIAAAAPKLVRGDLIFEGGRPIGVYMGGGPSRVPGNRCLFTDRYGWVLVRGHCNVRMG